MICVSVMYSWVFALCGGFITVIYSITCAAKLNLQVPRVQMSCVGYCGVA